MYSKIKTAGHPVHPMLVAFPVACYVGTPVGFAVYAANGHLFWLNLAIALSVTAPEHHRHTERGIQDRGDTRERQHGHATLAGLTKGVRWPNR